MARKYTIHTLDGSLLKDGKWDKKALAEKPFFGTRIGEGSGDIRDKVIAKSYKSRGKGYPDQEIRASKFAPFQIYASGKEEEDDPLEVLELSNGVLTSTQGYTSTHDKSFLKALIEFIDSDLKDIVSDPDETQHWKYEDVSGDDLGFMVLLEGKRDGEERKKHPFLVKNAGSAGAVQAGAAYHGQMEEE